MKDCIFCRIGSGEQPCLKVCEDEHTIAFMDIAKDVDGHILVIPKMHYKNILDCDYENEAFEAMAKGLEEEPERGKRCYLCYKLRLEKTARIAKEQGFEWFCTTLSLSPYKNAEWLNEIGRRVGEEYGVHFLPSDFKKKGGYHRSVALSNEYGLYRQDFCGCRFSKKKGSN